MAHYLGHFFLNCFLEALEITYCLCSLGCFLPKGKLINIGQFLNHLNAGVHRNRGAILLGSPSHLFAPYLRVPVSYSWEVVISRLVKDFISHRMLSMLSEFIWNFWFLFNVFIHLLML